MHPKFAHSRCLNNSIRSESFRFRGQAPVARPRPADRAPGPLLPSALGQAWIQEDRGQEPAQMHGLAGTNQITQNEDALSFGCTTPNERHHRLCASYRTKKPAPTGSLRSMIQRAVPTMLAVPLTVGRTARLPPRSTSPSRQPSKVPLPKSPSLRIG